MLSNHPSEWWQIALLVILALCGVGGPISLVVGAVVRHFDAKMRAQEKLAHDAKLREFETKFDQAERNHKKCEEDGKARESQLLAALEQVENYRKVLPEELVTNGRAIKKAVDEQTPILANISKATTKTSETIQKLHDLFGSDPTLEVLVQRVAHELTQRGSDPEKARIAARKVVDAHLKVVAGKKARREKAAKE